MFVGGAAGRFVRRFYLFKTGSTPEPIRAEFGDFEHWFLRHLGVAAEVRALHEGDSLPALDETERVLITGSPHMVTERHPWSEAAAAWLKSAHEQNIPLLGVCYGHQLLAHALGGQVDWNPNGRQIGLTNITFTDAAQADPLLSALAPQTRAYTTHRQVVRELPTNAVRLAATAKDPNHAFRIGARSWGVQFHPEFDGPIMAAYVRVRRDALIDEAFNLDALTAELPPTPAAHALLARFAVLDATR
jgi:GMP synthase (glutamine-hydrolysing)